MENKEDHRQPRVQPTALPCEGGGKALSSRGGGGASSRPKISCLSRGPNSKSSSKGAAVRIDSRRSQLTIEASSQPMNQHLCSASHSFSQDPFRALRQRINTNNSFPQFLKAGVLGGGSVSAETVRASLSSRGIRHSQKGLFENTHEKKCSSKTHNNT